MTHESDLDGLAQAAGIEGDYWDIWGNHHQIGALAKRRILKALGIPAEDDDAVAASRHCLDTDDWRRPLPPVMVVRDNADIAVPVTLDSGDMAPLTLVVTEENGRRFQVDIRPETLTPVAEKTVDGRPLTRYAVPLPEGLAHGYHTVRLGNDDAPGNNGGSDAANGGGDEGRTMRLIVAPQTCYLPDRLDAGGTAWGLSTQLYTLRHDNDWGIGDFTDLMDLIDVGADFRASVIGLNPLHALFPRDPERASPYQPSSRLFLNPLYISIETIPEYAGCRAAVRATAAAEEQLARLRAADDVNYTDVTRLKLQVLDVLFRAVDAGGVMSADRQAAFQRFCDAGGTALKRFAIFEALSEKYPGTPWPSWPEPLRRPDTPEVDAFSRERAHRVRFFMFLQWLADEQMAACQDYALDRGLSVGLYRDLAVGCALDGADAWIDPEVVVDAAKVGCPPDPFNMLGQDWEVPPLHPHAMRRQGYEPFARLLRANMRHAGALRIDHAMGLMHLFWMPADGVPADGAYVAYPFEDLLGVLALESQRLRCLIVGEDLGTVPDGFRERMADMNILSYRVLYFEKDGDRFKRPDEYPRLALACVTTHDLATLNGFWQGSDIDLRQRLDLYPSGDAEAGERSGRATDRQTLLGALVEHDLLSDEDARSSGSPADMNPVLSAALHGYLARSPASLLLVQVDDLTEETDQVNLPGTVDERPNWRRRLGMTVGDIRQSPVIKALQPLLQQRNAPTTGPGDS
jgi:4-alpha-glucanotransferase